MYFRPADYNVLWRLITASSRPDFTDNMRNELDVLDSANIEDLMGIAWGLASCLSLGCGLAFHSNNMYGSTLNDYYQPDPRAGNGLLSVGRFLFESSTDFDKNNLISSSGSFTERVFLDASAVPGIFKITMAELSNVTPFVVERFGYKNLPQISYREWNRGRATRPGPGAYGVYVFGQTANVDGLAIIRPGHLPTYSWHSDEEDSFQRILCEIFADTSEDSEGVLFFMESSVFNSTITAFPITSYYKLPEEYIKLGSGATCTVIPTTDIQSNLVPVAPADFISDEMRNCCETNNYGNDSSTSIASHLVTRLF
ncbi:hypothetical protein GJ496_011446 [Pomphorhynchus laevis]|nr:hypothetical protein GJ496_011446 [Pomphorhynchus laevis]